MSKVQQLEETPVADNANRLVYVCALVKARLVLNRDNKKVCLKGNDDAEGCEIRIPGNIVPALMARLKIMLGMDIADKGNPQKGQLKIKLESEEIEIRGETQIMDDNEELIVERI